MKKLLNNVSFKQILKDKNGIIYDSEAVTEAREKNNENLFTKMFQKLKMISHQRNVF